MKYAIKYIPATEEMAPAEYTVTYLDRKAKAFMKAINKELIKMEANRKIEFKHVLKEGAREQPHRQMKRDKDKFSFDDFQVEDVCKAAQDLIGQRIKVSFIGPTIEIIPEHVEDFERVIDTERKR